MKATRKALLGALMMAAMACAPAAGDAARARQSAPAIHPLSGLQVLPLTITHAGRKHVFRVEIARTGPEQARGLMYRTAMGVDEGMIFPMDPPRGASFWMKNTPLPLDLVFIGPDGRISNIERGTPYDLTPIRSIGLAKAVLELNAGRSAELGIVAGDKVEW